MVVVENIERIPRRVGCLIGSLAYLAGHTLLTSNGVGSDGLMKIVDGLTNSVSRGSALYTGITDTHNSRYNLTWVLTPLALRHTNLWMLFCIIKA